MNRGTGGHRGVSNGVGASRGGDQATPSDARSTAERAEREREWSERRDRDARELRSRGGPEGDPRRVDVRGRPAPGSRDAGEEPLDEQAERERRAASLASLEGSADYGYGSLARRAGADRSELRDYPRYEREWGSREWGQERPYDAVPPAREREPVTAYGQEPGEGSWGARPESADDWGRERSGQQRPLGERVGERINEFFGNARHGDRPERGGPEPRRVPHYTEASLWNRVKGVFTGKGPKNYVRSDERIREDVCERLCYHPYVDATDVEVMVANGEVTLTGTVDDREAKRLTEDVAADVRGVIDVHNQLRLRPEPLMRGRVAGPRR